MWTPYMFIKLFWLYCYGISWFVYSFYAWDHVYDLSNVHFINSDQFLWVKNGALHDDVIKWKHFPRYLPFVQIIHWSPVNSPTKASDAELWCLHDEVIKWKHFPRSWLFVGNSPVSGEFPSQRLVMFWWLCGRNSRPFECTAVVVFDSGVQGSVLSGPKYHRRISMCPVASHQLCKVCFYFNSKQVYNKAWNDIDPISISMIAVHEYIRKYQKYHHMCCKALVFHLQRYQSK